MSLAEQMAADAKEGQRVARKFFVIGLDFSIAGLAELDDAAGNVDVFMRGGASEENLQLLTKTWGAYLGEVLTRHADATWEAADNPHGAKLRTAAGELVSPHERIRLRVTEGEQYSLPAFAEASQAGGL